MTKNRRIYCCMDCGGLICLRTAFYGIGRCNSCENKRRWSLNLYKDNNLKGENNPCWKGGLPTCSECGKLLSNYDTKMCIICFPKSRKNKPRMGKIRKGKNSPSYKDGRSIKPNYCIDCGEKVSWTAKRCYDCWSKQNVGKNNGNYIHGKGYKNYPIIFNNRLKFKIRKRDNFTCQCCGKREENYVNLSIHHIDYNKQNCEELNLITTCNICNIKANTNRDYWFAYYTYKIENNYE